MKLSTCVIIQAFVIILCLPGISIPGRQVEGRTVSLLTPPTTLMQQIRQSQAVFMVDTRLQNEFTQFKIPGSLNIPAALIKTKAFLKTRPVVLIDKGVAHTDLLFLAKALNTKGFTVSVLEGGLAAWRQKGGALVGNPFSIRQMNEINARTLFAGQAKEEWLIMDFSVNPLKPHPVPKAVTIKSPGPDGKQQNFVQSFLNSHEITGTSAIIIFNETGQDYDALKQQFPAPVRHKVFTLSGGLAAYGKFLTSHRLATRSKIQRTKTAGECEPCSKKTTQKTRPL